MNLSACRHVVNGIESGQAPFAIEPWTAAVFSRSAGWSLLVSTLTTQSTPNSGCRIKAMLQRTGAENSRREYR